MPYFFEFVKGLALDADWILFNGLKYSVYFLLKY